MLRSPFVSLKWIEGPPDVWTAEIEDTCRYPDDDDPGAFLVSIRSDEDGLRIDVEHSTRSNRLDSDWIESGSGEGTGRNHDVALCRAVASLPC